MDQMKIRDGSNKINPDTFFLLANKNIFRYPRVELINASQMITFFFSAIISSPNANTALFI